MFRVKASSGISLLTDLPKSLSKTFSVAKHRMNYLRECWNAHISSADVLTTLAQANEDSRAEFINSILVVLSGAFEVPPIVGQYAICLFDEMPHIFSDLLYTFDESNGVGFMKLIALIGTRFFECLPIDSSERSATCTLNILRFCLTSEARDSCEKAFLVLAESPRFAILAAMSRQFHETEIQGLQSKFLDMNASRLHRALFSNETERGVLLTHVDVFVSLAAISPRMASPSVFDFVTRETFYRLYLKSISMFFADPSLCIGRVVVKVLASACPEGVDSLRSFCDGGSECFLSDEMIEKLTAEPEKAYTAHGFIAKLYSSPANARNCEQLFQWFNRDNVRAVIDFFADNIEDITLFIHMEGKTLDWIHHVITVCYEIRDSEVFASCWFYLLAVLRFLQRMGLSKVLEGIDNPRVSYFIDSFLKCKQSEIRVDPSALNNSTTLDKCVFLLHRLFERGNSYWRDALDMLKQNTFLWPSVLTWCLAFPRGAHRELATLNIPGHPLVVDLLKQLMIMTSDHTTNICESDIHYQRWTKGDIKQSLVWHLTELSGCVSANRILSIASCWRVWHRHCGGTEFTKLILQSIPVTEDTSRIYESVACVLSHIVESNLQESSAIIDAALECEPQTLREALGLSHLCSILITLVEKDWEMLFDRVISKCCHDLDHHDPRSHLPDFALSFINIATFTPCMQRRLLAHPCTPLMQVKCSDSAISYFVVKSKL